MSRTCPSCSAALPPGSVECAYCGSRVTPVALSFAQREELRHLIESLNASMEVEKKRLLRGVDLLFTAAWLAGIAVLLALWLYYRLFTVGWVTILVFSTLAVLVRHLFRRFRLVNGLIHFFIKEVEPQISTFLEEHELPRWQFDQITAHQLGETEPLRKFMFSRSRE